MISGVRRALVRAIRIRNNEADVNPAPDMNREVSQVELKESKDNKSPPKLRQCLSFWFVVLFGLANTIGTGIFTSPGKAAVSSGPALCVSFWLSGLGCALSGLSYASFAARISSAGGSYSYVYSSLGEFLAFVTGFCLTLEYGVSSSAIARGCSTYLRQLLRDYMHVAVPGILQQIPVAGSQTLVIDLLAALLCAMVALICAMGIKESQSISSAITVLNISVVLLVVVVGLTYFDASNFDDFAPNGASGVLRASSSLFFSFIGWDAMCVLSEEVKDPLRTIPKAIITTLSIVTAVYSLMGVSMMGMTPYTWLQGLSNEELSKALVLAFETFGNNTWIGWVITIVACSCAINATYGTTQGQPRVLFCMGKDGLLPSKLTYISREKQVPTFAILCTACMTTTFALLLDFHVLADGISAGCLLMQCLVCMGCLVQRAQIDTRQEGKPLAIGVFLGYSLSVVLFGLSIQQAALPWVYASGSLMGFMGIITFFFCVRSVRRSTPSMSFLSLVSQFFAPLAGVTVNLVVMSSQGVGLILQLLVFLAVCAVVYFSYSQFHSTLGKADEEQDRKKAPSEAS